MRFELMNFFFLRNVTHFLTCQLQFRGKLNQVFYRQNLNVITLYHHLNMILLEKVSKQRAVLN